MRLPRIKAEGQSFYHCVSRVVDRQFIFQTAGHGSPEAERFVLLCDAGGLCLSLMSKSFVESHFYNLKRKLGYKRRCPATRLTALGCADTLWVFRDLRVRTIG